MGAAFCVLFVCALRCCRRGNPRLQKEGQPLFALRDLGHSPDWLCAQPKQGTLFYSSTDNSFWRSLDNYSSMASHRKQKKKPRTPRNRGIARVSEPEPPKKELPKPPPRPKAWSVCDGYGLARLGLARSRLQMFLV